MNLHSIVAPVVGAVNPLQEIGVQVSVGQTSNADGTLVPVYATPGAITASVGGTFTATASGTTLTVETVLTGSLWPGDAVSGNDGVNALPADTTVLAQLSGSLGGAGTYELSAETLSGTLNACEVTSESTVLNVTQIMGGQFSVTAVGLVLTVASVISGSLWPGNFISANDGTNALPVTCQIAKQLSGTPGGVGTYQLSAGTVSGTLNSCTATVAGGQLQIGQSLADNGALLPGTLITGFGTGNGGVGNYNLNQQQLVPSEVMTTTVTLIGQLQPLAGNDLRHVDMINLQGSHKVLYIASDLRGAVRPALKGGDLVILQNGSVWLVQQTLEPFYDTAGWTKILLTLQNDALLAFPNQSNAQPIGAP